MGKIGARHASRGLLLCSAVTFPYSATKPGNLEMLIELIHLEAEVRTASRDGYTVV